MVGKLFKLAVESGWGFAVAAGGAAIGNAAYDVLKYVLENTLFKKEYETNPTCDNDGERTIA